MAGVENIVTAGHVYQVVDDLATFYQALIVGTVRDELTTAPLRVPFTAQVDWGDTQVQSGDAGRFYVAGEAARVFPDPTVHYLLRLDIAAADYYPESRTVDVLPGTAFPVHIADVVLRPRPVRIQGRVVDDGPDRTPLAGAAVSIVDPSSPVAGESVIALRTPLHYDHAGVTVRACAVQPSGAGRTLVAPAPAGATTVLLSERSGLAAQSILQFRGPADVWIEYYVVESVSNDPADPTQPGAVTLSCPLNHSFPKDSAVQAVTIQPLTSGTNITAHLTRPARAGEGLLILDAPLAVPATGAIDFDEPAARHEYHGLGAVADGSGFYRLEGIGQLPSVRLQAQAAAHKTATREWTIDYGQPVNVVDFRLAK